jgi:hypothetical protein
MKHTALFRYHLIVFSFLTVFRSGNTQRMNAEISGQWGLKVAYKYSILSFQHRFFEGSPCEREIKNIDFINLSGAKIGAFYETYLSEKLSIHAGADLFFSNSRIEIEDCFFCDGNLISENKQSLNPGSLQLIIPITIRYQRTPEALFLETGMFTSLSLGASYGFTSTRHRQISPSVLLPVPVVSDTELKFKTHHAGIHYGIGKQIGFGRRKLELKAIYYLGLNTHYFTSFYLMKQSGAEFSVAYRI